MCVLYSKVIKFTFDGFYCSVRVLGVVSVGRNKRTLPVKDLKVGMIVTKEYITDGKVLIGQGYPITEWALKKLREKYFFSKIEVYYEEDDTGFERGIKKVKTVAEIEKIFTELSFDVEKIFEDMETLKISKIEEIRNFAKRIQSELESVSSVIKNIVLYGSGSDTIYRHGVNVAALSTILGRWLDLNEDELDLLTLSAVLHDFGKVKVNTGILDKPGPLTDKEFKEIKTHPVIGYNYVKEIPYLDRSVIYGILMHHEKLDGLGYPLGLRGDMIHPFARIIAVADVFDAVNSNRRYKKSKGPFEALEIVKKDSYGKLDYEYCNVFLSHVVNYYMGENVLLNDGRICKIIQVDINDLRRPLMLDNSDFIDLKKQKDLYIERLVL